MRAIRCFLVVPTDHAEWELRRHARTDGPSCAATGFPYHHATTEIEDGVLVQTADGSAVIESDWPHEDGRWPTLCACGYAFRAEDEWHVAVSRRWCDPETGEEFRLRDAPVGAMWFADWFRLKGPDGHALVVMTPAGPWLIDRPTADGIFYVRTGAPPRVAVEQPVTVHGPVPFRGWLCEGLLSAA